MKKTNKKKVDMLKRKNKYIADKVVTLTGDYQKVGARGTFNNLYKNLGKKI